MPKIPNPDDQLNTLIQQMQAGLAKLAAQLRALQRERNTVRSEAHVVETKRQAARRLQTRTRELSADTRALGTDKKPFSKPEHDALRAKLADHQRDLQALRDRPEANGTASRTRRKVTRKRSKTKP